MEASNRNNFIEISLALLYIYLSLKAAIFLKNLIFKDRISIANNISL
jgi:hypothetical protein